MMSDLFVKGPCGVCGEAGLACGRCRLRAYCSKEHQKQDWPQHKTSCGLVELRSDPVLGRHLVATKSIPARTIIMREMPLVVFPAASTTEQKLACVGCCSVGVTAQCGGCGWPVCYAACSAKQRHHDECEAFQRANFKIENANRLGGTEYDALGALRVHMASREQPCLLQLQGDWDDAAKGQANAVKNDNIVKKSYKIFISMVSFFICVVSLLISAVSFPVVWLMMTSLGATCPSLEDLIGALTVGIIHINSLLTNHGVNQEASQGDDDKILKKGYDAFRAAVDGPVAWLQKSLGATCPPLEDLNRALGCMHINSFHTSHGDGMEMIKSAATAIYAGLSLVEHACRPNARTALIERGSEEVVLVAARDIAVGEHVSISYNDKPLDVLGTRRLRSAARGFICRCELCSDVTERGTHLSSWCCTKCTKSDRRQSMVLLVGENGWRCDVCGSASTEGDVKVMWLTWKFTGIARKVVMSQQWSLGEQPQGLWKSFIEESLWPRGPLHPTHHLVVQAKCELLGIGDNQIPMKIAQSTEEADLLVLVKTCKEVLGVVNELVPPINTFRLDVAKHLYRLLGGLRRRTAEVESPREERQRLLEEIDHMSISPRERGTFEHLRFLL